MQSFWIVFQKLLYLWTAMFQNLAYRQYSICGSPTGCLPSLTTTVARGFAIVHNLSQHSALLSAISSVIMDSHCWRLKGSDWNIMSIRRIRYCDDQYSICSNPTGCLPTLTTTVARGLVIVHNLSQHSALLSAISSVIMDSHCWRLKVSDWNIMSSRRIRYCDDKYSICGSPTGCLSARATTPARGVAVVHNLSQHSALLSAISSFIANLYIWRLKVSDINTIGQRPMASIIQSPATSLKGSDRYSLRHRRRSNTEIYPFSQSLKGSYRFSFIHQSNSEIQWLNH